MDIVYRVIGGVILSAIGISLIMKTEWFVQNFGTIEWAEQKMGSSGGTRAFLKLIGIGIIFFGFLFITGMFSGFMRGTLVKALVPAASEQQQ